MPIRSPWESIPEHQSHSLFKTHLVICLKIFIIMSQLTTIEKFLINWRGTWEREKTIIISPVKHLSVARSLTELKGVWPKPNMEWKRAPMENYKLLNKILRSNCQIVLKHWNSMLVFIIVQRLWEICFHTRDLSLSAMSIQKIRALKRLVAGKDAICSNFLVEIPVSEFIIFSLSNPDERTPLGNIGPEKNWTDRIWKTGRIRQNLTSMDK